MYLDTSITIFAYMGGAYNRYYIGSESKSGVHWEEQKSSEVGKTGIILTEGVTVYIPLSNMPNDLAFTGGKDIVIKGIITESIDSTSEATVSSSIKALRAKYYADYPKGDLPSSDDFPKSTYESRYVTISGIESRLYGSPNMQHIKLSCK